MTETPPLDLFGIFGIIAKRKRLIITTALLAAIAGILFYIIKPPRYRAEVVFILKNPLYSDRNYLYNNETKFIDYFANDDDVDRLMTMARSDSVQGKIIKVLKLAEAYDYDVRRPKEVIKLLKFFNKNLNIYRTEQKNIVLTYIDKDQKRAINVATMCVAESERALHNFYIQMRSNMHASIVNKINEEDSAIRSLTDTLSALRVKYGIYDIISPARYNVMLSSFKDNGKPDYARGIEEVQNVEAIKDELVADKAKHTTLANQYSTGIGPGELPFTYITNMSRPPLKRAGTDFFTIFFTCLFAGTFFSALYVLAVDFYQRIGQKKIDEQANAL